MKFLYGMMNFKMDKAGGEGGNGGGGGGANGGGQGGNGNNDGGNGGGQGGNGDIAAQLKALQDRVTAQDNELKTLRGKNNSGGNGGGNNNEVDLREQAEKERREKESKAGEIKAVESAVKFNLGLKEFVEKNKELLPKEVSDILRLSDRETYGSEVARANALKAAFMQSYFLVQDNLADLTAAQKESVAQFLKLSQTGREAKAAELYDTVFEPALEVQRKVKKASELIRAKNGYASTGSGAMDSYKQKLLEAAQRGIINRKKGA